MQLLPDTLAELREGVANLRQVSADLTGVSANLKRISDALDAAGLAEATEAMQKTGEAFRGAVGRFEEAEKGFRRANDALIDSVSWVPGAKQIFEPFRRDK